MGHQNCSPITWDITGLPEGLNFNPQTSRISGKPTAPTSGARTLRFCITDKCGNTACSDTKIIIDPTPVLTPPNIPSVLPSGDVGSHYRYTPPPLNSHPNCSPVYWNVFGLPPGLQFDQFTGVISGIPSTATSTPATIMICAWDQCNNNECTSTTLSIHSTPPPILPSIPPTLPEAQAGRPYSGYTFQQAVTHPNCSASSWSVIGLPQGLNFNPNTRTISGTPLRPTTTPATINICVTDSCNQTTCETTSITVNPDPDSNTTNSITTFTSTNNYTSPPSQQNTNPSPSTSTTPIASPSTPSHPPTSSGPTPPTIPILPKSLPSGNVGAKYIGFTPPPVTYDPSCQPLTWNISGLPKGLNFDPTTGTIFGTPQIPTSGPKQLIYTVYDGCGHSISAITQITINNPTDSPQTTPLPNNQLQAMANEPITHQFTATNSPSQFFALGTLPGTINISPSGLLTGQIPTPGSYPISIQATNGTPSPIYTFTIVVSAPQPQTQPSIPSPSQNTPPPTPPAATTPPQPPSSQTPPPPSDPVTTTLPTSAPSTISTHTLHNSTPSTTPTSTPPTPPKTLNQSPSTPSLTQTASPPQTNSQPTPSTPSPSTNTTDSTIHLCWATYYGGNEKDTITSVTTDSNGNLYITGTTNSPTNIATSGTHKNTYSGGDHDAFVAKFDNKGKRLWATYIGGAGDDQGLSITHNPQGDIYVSGSTTSNEIALNGFNNTYGGNGVNDAFLARLDENQGKLIWLTYYGGPQRDDATAVSTDPTGHILLTGRTHSNTGISSPGALQTNKNKTPDAFIAKFTSQGARLWGTYFGGESTDIAHSIAADSKGNIIIVGETTTQNNLMPSGYQNTFGGGIYDGFILSINPEGNSINWRTYIGGPGNDWLHTVTIDSADSVIVAGRTSSKSAITKSASQNTYGGGAFDAIIAKFDSKGNLTWSTYYGGKGNDIAFGITTDTSDNLYIAGQTTSRDNIAQNGVRNRKSGKIDAFLVKLSPSGSRLWGTYYGRLQDDQGFAVATDPLGNIYLVGQTQSTGTETTSPHQATYAAGEADGFIACYNTNCN